MTERQLIEKLKELEQLKNVVRLSDSEKKEGLDLFMQKVHVANQEKVNSVKQIKAPVFGWLTRVKEVFATTNEIVTSGLRLYSSHIFASLIITILVFGTAGAYSGMLATQALPDDKPLYTLKRALEKTQLTLSFSSSQRTAVRINHLNRRVEELDKIVAKTVTDPKVNSKNVSEAIKNTQSEVVAVKQDLEVAAAESVGEEELAELKELVERHVYSYQIALSDVEEGLPEDLKEELKPQVAALNSSLSEINNVIEQLNQEKVTIDEDDENPFMSDLTSTEPEVFVDTPTTTPETTTQNIILENEVDVSTQTEEPTTTSPASNPSQSEQIGEEEAFIEQDTFEVHIGN